MQKSTWSGLGAWVLALVAGLGSSGWPELIKPHPYVVVSLGIGGLLSLAYSFVNKQSYETPATSLVPSINVSPVITVSPVVSPTQNSVSSTLSPRKAQPERVNAITPHVKITNSELALVHYDGTLWSQRTGFQLAALIWVENKEAPVGERTTSLNNIAAKIVFSQHGQVVANIARAYWIGHSQNAIRLDIGERHALLLGIFEGDMWTYCSNPYSQSWIMPSKLSSVHLRKVQLQHIENAKHVEATVTVLSLSSGLTIASARYMITNSHSGVAVEEIK